MESGGLALGREKYVPRALRLRFCGGVWDLLSVGE